MTIADIRQALFEQLYGLETKYAVQFSRGATLYINPTNAFGEDVPPRMPGGHELKTLYNTGPTRARRTRGSLGRYPRGRRSTCHRPEALKSSLRNDRNGA